MLINICVVNQRVVVNDYRYIVNDSIDYLYCHFCFSEDWTGEKTAIFKTADKSEVYHVLVDENSVCAVPSAVLKGDGFYISAFCGDLITADEVFVKTEQSGYADGGKPPPPEKDIYNQIIQLINSISAGGGGGIAVETDPTVPDWAKQENPPEADTITNTEILEIMGVMKNE
jgi:hypothetical protein